MNEAACVPGIVHYNYFRDYDAATGKYVESDPVGLSVGDDRHVE